MRPCAVCSGPLAERLRCGGWYVHLGEELCERCGEWLYLAFGVEAEQLT